MTKKELEHFEKLLLDRRTALISELGLLRKTAQDTIKEAGGEHSAYAYHMADLGTDAMEREKTFLLASKSGRLLYHIDEALRRIRSKTYGNCHQCGDPIAKTRLEAVPHARLCINCKELEEQQKRR
jgi:RNA polymerase-binding protein DksA